MTKEDEGKTLFEHLGIGGGNSFGKYKGMIKSLLVMTAIGFLIGTMLDVYLHSDTYGILIAIVMVILWILKVFGSDLKSLNETKKSDKKE